MLGAITGDIIGSIYEFNNIKTKDFELFGPDCRFTDDTVLTVAVADWLTNRGDLVERLTHYAFKYNNRCYGGMFKKWVSQWDRQPYKSWGNGSAMRVSAVGWIAKDEDEVFELAKASAEVTHNHPEGIKGAQATALAIYIAKRGAGKEYIRQAITDFTDYDLTESVDEIREWYYFNASCQKTVPQAITCALEATDFEDAIRNAISIGGDSDTVAAITGSIAEAMFGIPEWIKTEARSYLPDEFCEVTNQLTECAKQPETPISQEIITAYGAANYRVFSQMPFVLKIGQPSEPLRNLHEEHCCAYSAFITGWNPYSVVASDAENVKEHTRLENKLMKRSLPFIAGIGEDSAGIWPGEQSVLVLGIALDEAKSLGMEFSQNAIVWSGEDATPQLILLR